MQLRVVENAMGACELIFVGVYMDGYHACSMHVSWLFTALERACGLCEDVESLSTCIGLHMATQFSRLSPCWPGSTSMGMVLPHARVARPLWSFVRECA